MRDSIDIYICDWIDSEFVFSDLVQKSMKMLSFCTQIHLVWGYTIKRET